MHDRAGCRLRAPSERRAAPVRSPILGPRADDRNLIVLSAPDELPSVRAGQLTPQVRARAKSFYGGVAGNGLQVAARLGRGRATLVPRHDGRNQGFQHP